MAAEGERIATLEQLVRDLRDDVREMRAEEGRTRKRLHDLEGVAGLLVDQEKQRRVTAAEQAERLKLRLTVIGLILSAAVLVSPFVTHFAFGG